MSEFWNDMLDVLRIIGGIPMQLWRESHTLAIGIAVVIIAFIVLIIAVRITTKRRNRKSIRHKQTPRKSQSVPANAKPCQHHECGRQLTTHVSKGFAGCDEGPCCADCHLRHQAEAEVRRFNNGRQIICPEPTCRSKMVAVLKNGYLAHECRNGCHGAFIGGKYMRKVGNG